jgi:hypothetical protein
MTISPRGGYRITGGIGKYAGITGHGATSSASWPGARSGGKCTQNKPAVAFHQVINAGGPVSVK